MMGGERVNVSDDMLVQTLGAVWHEMSRAHDVVATMPEMAALFAGATRGRPYEMAETVLANMLIEIMERVDRFSPWYTRPASAYGLAAVRRTGAAGPHWRLSEAGCRQWWHLLDRLAPVVEENRALIEAMILVDTLMGDGAPERACVFVRCSCRPPRVIEVRPAILDQAQILCSLCQRPFAPVP